MLRPRAQIARRGAALALIALCLAAPAARAQQDEGEDEDAQVARLWGFSRGRSPLAIGAPPPGLGSLRAEACEDCHPIEAAEWRASGHRQSWTRPLFQRAYALEPMAECRNCHQPLTVGRRGAAAAALRAEGITCAVCHVRDGQVLSARRSGRAPHPVKEAPLLGSSSFCGGCHQFPFPEHRNDGALVFSDEPMQDTLAEWRRHGGRRSCQGCHMPAVSSGGRSRVSHRFPGGYDQGLLAQAVQVTVEVAPGAAGQGATLRLRLRVPDTGHAVPTGDLFRSLLISAEVLDRGGRKLGAAEPVVLTRRFMDVAEPQPDGRVRLLRRQALDERLLPGQERAVALPLPQVAGATAARFRVALHRLPPGAGPAAGAVSVIHEGVAALPGPALSLRTKETER